MFKIIRNGRFRHNNSEISPKRVCGGSTRAKLAREAIKSLEEMEGEEGGRRGRTVPFRAEVVTSSAERLQSSLHELRIEIDSCLIPATTCKLHPGATKGGRRARGRKGADFSRKRRIVVDREGQGTPSGETIWKRKGVKKRSRAEQRLVMRGCEERDASRSKRNESRAAGATRPRH